MSNPTTRLSDPELLAALRRTFERSNEANVDFLVHLGEVDARGLYLPEACSSMFTYCTQRLHMAEGVTNRSLAAARAGRAFPVVFDMMRRNEVHTTAVAMLAKHLTTDNHLALLTRAKHQTKDAVAKLVAELQPQPAKPYVVRRLPVPGAATPVGTPPASTLFAPVGDRQVALQVTTVATSLPGVLPTPAPAPEPSEHQLPRQIPARIEPTAADSYRIAFSADEEFVTLLNEVRDLAGHQVPRKDVASLFRLALVRLREDLLRQKTARTKRPQPSSPAVASVVEPAPTTAVLNATSTTEAPPMPAPPASRHIPNHIRREVWARDGGRCTFTSGGGDRCSETSRLEYDHLKPFAIHHEHAVDDIRLRCRAHNQWGAALVYGEEHMAKFRRER